MINLLSVLLVCLLSILIVEENIEINNTDIFLKEISIYVNEYLDKNIVILNDLINDLSNYNVQIIYEKEAKKRGELFQYELVTSYNSSFNFNEGRYKLEFEHIIKSN